MDIAQLLSQYGYLAVALGCFLEGETVLVLGAMAAQRGYLDLWLVMLAAFCGALVSDQFYFHLGRRCGPRLLAKWPRWRALALSIESRLGRWRDLFLFGFRFLYGLRVVAPLAIGLCDVSAIRVLIWNALGALLWAVSFALLGYSFGHAVEVVLGDVKQYELPVFLGIAALGVAVWAVRRFAAWRAARAASRDQGR